jgi:uncharacterized membrane protein YidH (DUF202 family)
LATSPRGHSLALLTAATFFVSLIFPISAAFANDARVLPRWWGVLDVMVAFVLMTLSILTSVQFQRYVTLEIRESSYRAYRLLINVILVVLVMFFVVGDRITWTYFLPGIAWRTWLVFFAWPYWVAALQSDRARSVLLSNID